MANFQLSDAERRAPAPRPAGLRPGRRTKGPHRPRFVVDGPFAEAKELVAASWPLDTSGGRRLPVGRYASVNGLRMYYEIHGTERRAAPARPLVVLHAALMTIDSTFSAILPALSRHRQVIAIEQQAHGRTSDVARPMNYRSLAEDTVALLRQLGVERADLMGFSMGGGIALAMALEYPAIVGKLMLVSSAFHSDGCSPSFLAALQQVTQLGSPHGERLKKDFQRVGARPEQWPRALSRIRELLGVRGGFELNQLRHIGAETLVVSGQYGVILREHTEQLAQLVPNARLQLLPGDDHDPKVLIQSAQLAEAFLGPVPRLPPRPSAGTPCQAGPECASPLG